MSKDHMRYDIMAREALRSVVRKAIKRAAREGLPGEHHFYITFQTQAPDVDIDPSLIEAYPQEMTIVLEHQFWDLDAAEDAFEVTLKFGGVPKYLRVPYTAVTKFYDPSVPFALQFDQDSSEKKKPAKTAVAKPKKKSGGADGNEKAEDKPEGAGEVVSLDAFRRNNN